MAKINWGIVGCGDVTEIKSGPAFNKVPNSALAAVMRRDAAKAADYARRHGVPRWYGTANDLINDPEVHAVYVATPPASHEEYTIAAINAGKPVYVEKPMACNHAAAKRMAEYAAQKNMPLTVAHYRRQQPRFKKVKQLIEEKAIGTVLQARLQLARTPFTAADLQDVKTAWRVDPTVAGGGMFHDLSPHQLDLMYYFFGPVKKAAGVATRQGTLYAADDLVAGSILFENNVVFSGSWCFNAAEPADYCEIQGTEGKIGFSVFSTDCITVEIKSKTETIIFDPLPHVQQPMIEAVVKYFLGEGPNPDSGQDGVEVMRLIDKFTS